MASSTNHYRKWSHDDEQNLIAMYACNLSYVEMAERLNRTEHAINARLTKLRKAGELDAVDAHLAQGDSHLQMDLPLDEPVDFDDELKRRMHGDKDTRLLIAAGVAFIAIAIAYYIGG